jgi:2-dehydro-3-deoxygluconokinase
MILGFGEIMMRLATEGRWRFRQALPGKLEATWGGGEANVCASLAMLGRASRFVTALPRHAITEQLAASLRGLGVDTSRMLFTDKGRLGIYFLETGANQRGPVVIYDREGSSIALTGPEEYDFAGALEGVTWVHVTGITPALSQKAFASTLALVKLAKSRGVRVCCDLNFRKKLWNWKPGTKPQHLARECMAQILPQVDLLIGNEEDAKNVLGIEAEGTSVEQGKINPGGYESVARQIVAQFPNLSLVAITLRESISADHNNWGGMLFDARARQVFFAPRSAEGGYRPYEIRNIVDRVGAGDAFSTGLLYALNSEEFKQPTTALEFAVAASCLKHSIPGDFNYATEDEIVSLMHGTGTGRIKR